MHGLPSGVVGARNPQPNFNQPRRENHLPPAEYWLENPASVPWQQMNGLPPAPPQQFSSYESQRFRGRPAYCSGLGIRGRSKRIRGEGRSRPGILPTPGFGGIGLARPESEPLRFPPLGSEEERQQKIAETADKLKLKLSSLTIEEPVNFWEDDLRGVSFSQDEEQVVANRGIPELRHDPPELNLTVNDFKDIGRVDPETSFNSGESAALVALDKNKSRVQAAEENPVDPNARLKSYHKNRREDVAESISDVSSPRSAETAKEATAGQRRATNSSKNDPASSESDQVKAAIERLNYALGYDRKTSTPNSSEKETAKVCEKGINPIHKPELTKSLEKLREVIKVDREFEKDEKSRAQTEDRTIIQPNAGPRLQPDVRMDFHPGIGPGYPGFQGFGHGRGSREIRNRFPQPFRPDHPVEIQPNFRNEFHPRFDHRPDPGLRNFNLPPRPLDPRMNHSEFSGSLPQRILNRNTELQLPFDPREPPPRFNAPFREDHQRNAAWYQRNELTQKFCPAPGPNGLQQTPGFHPRGPPPRFINHDQDLSTFGRHIVPPSPLAQEFPQIVPMGYPHVSQMHIVHQSGYFNPAMPPPNTAPCIIHKFPPPSGPPPSSVENQAVLQLPPIPMSALDIRSHPLRRPPSPVLSANQNPTPNMNDELEDMQEALEFAKKLMNMTEEEDDAPQSFDMPTFPDLPPIPSTEPSHLAEKLQMDESGNLSKSSAEKDEDCQVKKGTQGVELGPKIAVDESTRKAGLNKDEAQATEEEIRTRVIFNFNSKTKRIAQPDEWQHQNDEGALRHRNYKEKLPNYPTSDSPLEERCDTKLSESRNNRKNRPQLRDDKKSRESEDTQLRGDNLIQKESRIENAVEIRSKTPDDNTKGRPSGSKTANKSLLVSTVDANWKDKVINQFLKMSKNDICNMVNSSGLRKFDIAMKHLVKERKYSLSRERRCSADDAVKGAYDMSREEFMSQLSAMLDPSATVDVKNLPSKFIQHLSEVLKLDVESHLNDTADAVENNNMLDSFGNEDDDLFANYQPDNFNEFLDGSSNVAPSYQIMDRSLAADVKSETKPGEEIKTSADFNHLFDDLNNGNNSANESLPNMTAVEDIFSDEIDKTVQNVPQKEAADETSSQFISHGFIRARCMKTMMSEENADLDDIFSEGIAATKLTMSDNTESERRPHAEGWGRRKREDPDMFRNLTKEEWEAKCARSIDGSTDKEFRNRSTTPSSRDTSLSARSRSPRNMDRSLKSHQSGRNLSPPSPSKENTYNVNLVVHTTNEAADKWARASRDESLIESDSDGVSNCGSISSESDQSAASNVTKLLKVIKEREKMAKDMSLNETIRAEVAAEIERAKEEDKERQMDRKNRNYEKNKRKGERRQKRKQRRMSFEILAKDTLHQESLIKEELIIETDNEQFFDTSNNLTTFDEPRKPNSHSTADKNEETLSEVSFQEHNEALPHSEGALNTQDMLVAQEYAARKHESLSHSGIEKSAEDAEAEGATAAESPWGKFEFRETRNHPNNAAESQLKSGTKKIDIQAYKARKLQRNTKKDDKLKESSTPSEPLIIDPIIIQRSNPEDIQNETNSGDFGSLSKDEGEKMGSSDNLESGSKNEASLDGKDSPERPPRKETNVVPEQSEKKEDKKPSKETPKGDKRNEKSNLDEKVDKQRSRDSKRSTSRDDNRKSSKERSKHSSREKGSDRARSGSLDKSQNKAQTQAAQQNNNVVESRDRKTATHKDERIERRRSRSRKKLAEDREANRKTDREKENHVCDKIVTEKREDQVPPQKDDAEDFKNSDKCEEPANVSPRLTETAKASEDKPESTITEIKSREQTGESISEGQDISEFSKSKETKESTEALASETTNVENEFHVEKPQNDAENEPSSKEDNLTDGEIKESPLFEEEILSSEILKDLEAESENGSTEKSHESDETSDEVRTLLNDLIAETIFRVDLSNGESEAKETVVITEANEELNICREENGSSERGLANKNEHDLRDCSEYNTRELNSPQTPESPLKGFSEEMIKRSILGKRRLDKSVLEITEDYMQNKRSKDFDDIILDVISESAGIDPASEKNSREIAAERRKIETENAECFEELGSEVASRKEQTCTKCATPSGDTLSLGSSIDFDNSEFIVLSEISSDENFSQDEDCKPVITALPRGEELAAMTSPNNQPLSEPNAEENGATLSAEKTPTDRASTTSEESSSIKVPKSTNDSRLKSTHSKLRTDVRNPAKSSATANNAKHCASKKSGQSQSESIPNQGDNSKQTSDAANKDPAVSVFGECREKGIEESDKVRSEETQDLNKPFENDASSGKSIDKKPSVVDDDNIKRKISESKRNSKPDDSKDTSSRENRLNKNLHKIRHRHRTKHKKEKKSKLDEKQIREAVNYEEVVTVVKKQHTKEGVQARMREIDREIHKLMSEKMKLYQMLERGELPTEETPSQLKDEPELVMETVNSSRREPNPRSSNNEVFKSSAKHKSSVSKTAIEHSHLKSSKITSSCISEDDVGNRHNESQKDNAVKKPKKSHKHDRPAKQDATVHNEPGKSSADRSLNAKSSISKKKYTEDRSTSKKNDRSHSRSSSNNRRKEEEVVRKEEHARRNVPLLRETAEEDLTGVCLKDKKIDHHIGSKKKTNRISDSKDDTLRRVKKETLSSIANDEIEPRSETTCESLNVKPEKQPSQIHLDEGSQIPVSSECKASKKTSKGLALLAETYKRDKAVSKKRRAVRKGKKPSLKSLQKTGSTLSPSEEEMPLNLLLVKKLSKKRSPHKNPETNLSANNNTKIKRTTSTEVLDHVLEAINAVAENKTDEYQRSTKIKTEMEQAFDNEGTNFNPKAKVAGKTKPELDSVTNSAHTLRAHDSEVVRPVENRGGGKNLVENCPDDFRELDEFDNAVNFVGSKSESESKFPIDKIVEISEGNNCAEITKNKPRAMTANSKGETEQLSLFGNIYDGGMNEIMEGERGQVSCRQWSNGDTPRSDPTEIHTFNYTDDIPQFDDSDSAFMPQDQMPESLSISGNIDLEKGLDVLDSMLETVSSDLEGISSEDVPASFVKKGKRKRIASGESVADGSVPSSKRISMTKSEMMNCSVRLVDCKYTYLKNVLNFRSGQRCSILNTEISNDLPSLNVISSDSQTTTESRARGANSKSPFSLQRALDEEPRDWLLGRHELIDMDENLLSLNDEQYLTAGCNIVLNHAEGNSEYDDDDLEIINLQSANVSGPLRELSDDMDNMIEAYCSSATLSETGNLRALDETRADGSALSESNAQTTSTMDFGFTNSPRLSPSCSEQPAGLGLRAKPFFKLTEPGVHGETRTDNLDDTKIRISMPEDDGVGAETTADDIQIIYSPKNQETNDIEEVELPRIQYSVHKGPILDVKVFGDSILAASEDGVIYRYSQTCNGILNTYEGHKSAITCIYVLQAVASSGTTRDWLFSGSLDGSLRCFDITTSHQVRDAAEVGSPIQCMDQSWGVIFLGTKSGYVFRFHIKSHAFRGDEIKFSEESVLALKATTEGPRRVLIVASRSQPITIRDAQSGLFLRTVSGHKSHTVYSLMMDSNLVYCGTSSTAIPVFDFINGSQVKLYNAGPGIVCMRMYKWLLFAGCYDGNIYVFDTKEQRLVCSIPGPGNMLLSMDIVKNKMVAGSKDRRLHMWQMPEQVLTLLAGRT